MIRDIFLMGKRGTNLRQILQEWRKMTDETAYKLELRRITTLTGIRIPRVRERIRTIYGVHVNEAAGAASSPEILLGW